MAKKGDSAAEIERLHKSLISIGVDKDAAKRLAASRSLDNMVVSVYWKDGLEVRANSIWLVKLPEFLRGFAEEFPDGQVRWDPDYETANPAEDVAIRVRFNVQDDDQGGHFQPKPTLLEEEAYQRMLERSSYKGTKPVPAYIVVHRK